MASKREYEAAKREYAYWSDEQHMSPTKEMLKVVDLINEYERSQNQDA